MTSSSNALPFATHQLSALSPLSRAMGYRKFIQGQPVKILLLDGGYHLHEESFHALRRLGHKVYRASVKHETTQACMTSLLEGLVQYRPDFVLTINHIGFDADGCMGTLIDNLNMPLACWYCDNPLFVLRDGHIPAPQMSSLFVWERALMSTMRLLGAKDVHHLPLGCDVTKFAQVTPQEACWPVSFVGDSMQRPLRIWRKRVGRLGELRAAKWRDLLRNKRQPLAELALEEPRDALTWDALALGTYEATYHYRLKCVRAVADQGLHIFGDEGWRSQVKKGRWMGAVSYGQKLASVYARSAISINATSMQMPTAVNQRVFDVPMAGGFVVSDNQEDLAHHFVLEKEAVVYKEVSELSDVVRWYLAHPLQRDQVSKAAQARILACHTYEHRLSRLVETMTKRHQNLGPQGPLRSQPKVNHEALS